MNLMKKILLDRLPALIYAIVLTTITIVPYVPDNTFVVFLSVVVSSAIFVFLSRGVDKGKKRRCVTLYLIALIVLIYAFKMHVGGKLFYMWLLTGYEYHPDFIPYIVVMFVVCSLFYTVSSYYFTEFYFRGYIMIFMLLIPIAVYYKIVESVPVIYIVAVMLALLYLYSENNMKRILASRKIKRDTNRFKFLVMISMVIVVVCVVTPKSDVAKYRDTFDDIISMNPFTNRGINTISDISNESSASNYGYFNQNRLLYDAIASQDLYLRRTSFALYTGSKFVNKEEYNYTDWKRQGQNSNVNVFRKNMNTLYDMFPDIFSKYGIEKSDIPDAVEVDLKITLTPKNFKASYCLNTVRTYDIQFEEEKNLYKNINGAIQAVNGTIGSGSYTVSYYADIARYTQSIIDFSNKFDMETYKNFIFELYTACDSVFPNEIENIYDIENFLGNILSEVYATRKFTDDNVPESLKKLAIEITKDAKDNYEKAALLEQYFEKENFEYSLSYEPEDESIEYFVFNSKKGSCGNYATAMTLMARAVGLPARYTEGFLMTKKHSNGDYYISAGDSHAYVEIYLPGYGYTVFEPTVHMTDSSSSGAITGAIDRFSDIIEIRKENVLIFVLVIVLIIVFIAIFKMYIYDHLVNIHIRRSIKKSGYNPGVTYKYLLMVLKKSTKDNLKTYTPEEIETFVKQKYDIDISSMIDAYQSSVYGGKDNAIDINDVEKIIQIKWNLKKQKKASH